MRGCGIIMRCAVGGDSTNGTIRVIIEQSYQFGLLAFNQLIVRFLTASVMNKLDEFQSRKTERDYSKEIFVTSITFNRAAGNISVSESKLKTLKIQLKLILNKYEGLLI